MSNFFRDVYISKLINVLQLYSENSINIWETYFDDNYSIAYVNKSDITPIPYIKIYSKFPVIVDQDYQAKPVRLGLQAMLAEDTDVANPEFSSDLIRNPIDTVNFGDSLKIYILDSMPLCLFPFCGTIMIHRFTNKTFVEKYTLSCFYFRSMIYFNKKKFIQIVSNSF